MRVNVRPMAPVLSGELKGQLSIAQEGNHIRKHHGETDMTYQVLLSTVRHIEAVNIYDNLDVVVLSHDEYIKVATT